jgi:SAM-dependent methyltransferase
MAGEHWCRVVMNRETRRFVLQNDTTKLEALEISGTHWKSVPFKFYFPTAFPQFDICSSIVSSNRPDYPVKFDFIFIDQVLEHVRNPRRALENIREMLKIGGVAVVTTPFLIRLHGSPEDHWRWSETGMRLLLQEAGFAPRSIETHSWGNRACAVANLDDWVDYDPAVHSLENEPDYPCVVWAYAQRTLDPET